MINEVITLIVLVLISAFFSGTEMAYVAANKIKIEIRARKKNLAAESALYFINNPQNFFSTILIGNTIVNIAFASLFTILLERLQFTEFSILLFSTLILLIVGELIPKYFSRELADTIIYVAVLPLRLISFILYPLVKFTSSISSVVTRSNKMAEENMAYLFNKEDIELLVKESHQAGMVNKKESDIISKVFALSDQRVYEAMRPRTEIVGVEIHQTIDEVLKVFIESGFSKIPVYEENLDNIKGMIFAYDLFNNPKDLSSVIRSVIFVPETKKNFELLNEFLSKSISVAIVIDEFGGTAGIITMEDIIEELFGEIKDEYDIEENVFRRDKNGDYIISGRVEIDQINERFNLNIPIGDYETISGFITTHLGRIPNQREKVVIDNFEIIIIRSNNSKIELVRLKNLSDQQE